MPGTKDKTGHQTICANCVHATNRDEFGDWLCSAPAIKADSGVDPVTGKTCYMRYWEEKGYWFTVPRAEALCRDVNTGNCPHFEGKKWGTGNTE